MDHAVAVVQAYLYINGYFTVSEYPLIERSRSGNYRSATDIDILAVRFPQARRQIPGGRGVHAESESAFPHDDALGAQYDRTDMIIGEVKEGRAEINRGARDAGVLRATLTRFGCCDADEAHGVVTELLRNGHAATHHGHRVRMMAFWDECIGYVPGTL